MFWLLCLKVNREAPGKEIKTHKERAAFLLMLTMSLLSTALSFFVSPVCADLGFGRGSFTLYYSLMVAAGAVSASFLGNYMNKHGIRGEVRSA